GAAGAARAPGAAGAPASGLPTWARALVRGASPVPLWVGKRARFVVVDVETAGAGEPVAAAKGAGAATRVADGAGTRVPVGVPALHVSPAVARRLHLPPTGRGMGLRVRLRRDPDGLHLGPVIGLLLGDGVSPPRAGLVRGLARLLQACRPAGIVYAFTLRDVQHASAGVAGALWLGGAFRAPALLPLPDVVWNCGDAADELRPLVSRLCDGRVLDGGGPALLEGKDPAVARAARALLAGAVRLAGYGETS
ncbi:MAG: hypothetical protein IRZ18_08810, partial [Clostridia bacterium]|nr:hypothetical protein [Clostridia bacterium]